MDLDRLQVVSWDVDGTLYSLPRLRWAIARRALAGVVRGGFARNWRELRVLAAWRARMDAVRRADGNLAAVLAEAALLEERERVRTLERRWYGEAIARVG